eukprot:14545335-Alexandrium_andersonii.AAC.1
MTTCSGQANTQWQTTLPRTCLPTQAPCTRTATSQVTSTGCQARVHKHRVPSKGPQTQGAKQGPPTKSIKHMYSGHAHTVASNAPDNLSLGSCTMHKGWTNANVCGMFLQGLHAMGLEAKGLE